MALSKYAISCGQQFPLPLSFVPTPTNQDGLGDLERQLPTEHRKMPNLVPREEQVHQLPGTL